jgi:hypothetical protein
LLPGYAYAWDPELAAVSADGAFLYRARSAYGKIIPFAADSASGPQTALLLRALDRTSNAVSWDAQWTDEPGVVLETVPGLDMDSPRVILKAAWDDFLLLADTRQGAEYLTLQQLFTVDERLAAYGYLPEVFQAEILRRLAEPVFFLPAAMLILLAGWRLRARKKVRGALFPALALLPAALYVATLFFRGALNDLSIALSLSFNYGAILAACIAVSALSFIVSLILLASQHG